MGIVLEYLDGGDLSELVDKRWAAGGAGISEAEARRLFQQLIVAVDYCHRMGIANRDIKVRPRCARPHICLDPVLLAASS
jgi:serine/threonine-protein kinase SRK2